MIRADEGNKDHAQDEHRIQMQMPAVGRKRRSLTVRSSKTLRRYDSYYPRHAKGPSEKGAKLFQDMKDDVLFRIAERKIDINSVTMLNGDPT